MIASWWPPTAATTQHRIDRQRGWWGAEIVRPYLSSVHTIPGGPWEVFIGVWLIVKGFSTD
jgi:hypothetical protein